MKLTRTLQGWFENRRFQTVYLILLIVTVPTVIATNSLLLISDFQHTITIELQRKALLSANLIDITTPIDPKQPQQLQKRVQAIAGAGEEFEAIDILVPADYGFKVIASLEPAAIGKTTSQNQFSLAWQQQGAIAHATNASSRSVIESKDIPFQVDEERYWVVTKPIRNENGAPQALLSVKFSSHVINTLVGRILTKSYLLLMLTVLLTLTIIAAISQIFKSAAGFRHQVEQLDVVKSNFITVVSHVLRTPLNSMRWNLELLLSGEFGKVPKRSEEFIRLVYKSNLNVLQTVQDLIVALDIEQKTFTLSPQPLHIHDLLDSVLIALKPVITAKKLELKVVKAKNLPALSADPKLLEQAMYKLVDNAVKYTPDGGTITITLSFDKGHIIFKVADTGIGIPHDEQDKIFAKFYRGRNALKSYTDAAGLGLFVAKHIIDSHKGEVGFTSQEGKGSSFWFSLPLA